MPPADATDAPSPEDLYEGAGGSRALPAGSGICPGTAPTPLSGDRQRSSGLVHRWPDAFRGTELDPDDDRRKMEKLVSKIEALMPPDSKEPASELTAERWRRPPQWRYLPGRCSP